MLVVYPECLLCTQIKTSRQGGKQDSETIHRHCQGQVHARISSSLHWYLPVRRWPLETGLSNTYCTQPVQHTLWSFTLEAVNATTGHKDHHRRGDLGRKRAASGTQLVFPWKLLNWDSWSMYWSQLHHAIEWSTPACLITTYNLPRGGESDRAYISTRQDCVPCSSVLSKGKVKDEIFHSTNDCTVTKSCLCSSDE